MMKNWPITGSDGVPITATTSSAVTLVASSDVHRVAADVMIDNPGPLDVFVKAGGAGAAATLTSMRVPAGSLQPYAKGADATHIAVITASGTQAIVVHLGEGQ